MYMSLTASFTYSTLASFKAGRLGILSSRWRLGSAPARAASAAPKAANPFPADSNEHAIYAFLLGEMGYNRAAAMGVMANIKYESGYKPTSSSSTGAYAATHQPMTPWAGT